MAFPSPSTERRRRGRAALVVAALASVVWCAATVGAHEPQRLNSREIVRLAGTFGDAPSGVKTVRDVAVTVQGRERTLHATDWQVYALVVDQNAPVAPAPDRVTLQGTREDLARIANARPEQRVALLAERRPGMGELFLLAVDLCPEK
jgi:hypothetical protein